MKIKAVHLVPKPKLNLCREGEFLVDGGTQVFAVEAFKKEAQLFLNRLRESTGYGLCLAEVEGEQRVKLLFDSTLKPSQYRLKVSPDGIAAFASDGSGCFYALQTLLQLLPPAILGRGPRAHIRWAIPCCEIEDEPRFSWRGVMLDSARHFQPVDWIKKFIDLLAQHKINVFHWHLTDHQGWRIEIKKYPRLTEVGAWRSGTVKGHYFANGDEDGVPYGGFYTQEEVRDIIRYASDRHITIVPEIDMPGHCQAALAAYPELGCAPFEVGRRWGGSKAIFNPSEPTLAFLKDVLDEVISIFPGPYIHIGGDEADCEHWDASESVQTQMKLLGLATSKELHVWFIAQLGAFLTSRGRKMIGWDEIADGELPEGAMVMAWRAIERGYDAMKRGHDVVMAPYQKTYFDYYQDPKIEEEPLANINVDIGCLDLQTVYGFEPFTGVSEFALQSRIVGVQGQLWTEYMHETSQVEYMVFPRACALAEVGWSQPDQRDWACFEPRLRYHLKRLSCQNVAFRPL